MARLVWAAVAASLYVLCVWCGSNYLKTGSEVSLFLGMVAAVCCGVAYLMPLAHR